MTNQMPELLPCPFCGGEAKIHISGSKSSSHWYNVYCLKCNVQGYQKQAPQDCAKEWNTRARADLAQKTVTREEARKIMADSYDNRHPITSVLDALIQSGVVKVSE